MAPNESPRRHRERSHHHEKRRANRRHAKSRHESSSSQSGSQLLSANALAQLNQLNQLPPRAEELTPQKKRRKRHREVVDENFVVEKSRRQHKRNKRRVVSGALLEEGDSRRLKGLRGGNKYDEYKYEEYDNGKAKKRLCRDFDAIALENKADICYQGCSLVPQWYLSSL
jgi:glucan 1,3-beta-glucosidase